MRVIAIGMFGVYGAINLCTDGWRAVVTFRREQSKGTNLWFSYELEKDSNGISQVQDVSGNCILGLP